MKIYIDCVSGCSHLVELANKIYKDESKSKELRMVNLFIECYFMGAVPSVCGRRVIDSEVLINDLNKCIKNLETELPLYKAMEIIHLAFKGIWDNCAIPDDRFYLPL